MNKLWKRRNDQKIRVLHVDNEESFLDLAQLYVKKLSDKILIDSFSHPKKALNQIEQQQYDVIVSDYLMPTKTGLEILEIVQEKSIDIPFIILTGKGREEVAIQALNLGAKRYIRKGTDVEGMFTELVHSIENLAELKKTKQELEQREKLYSTLVSTSPDSIVITDNHGNLLYINQQTLDLFGYKNNTEMLGRNILEFITESEHIEASENIERIIEEKINIISERTFIRKDGSSFIGFVNVESFINPLTQENNLLGIIRDITEIQQTQQALKESEETYRAIFENTGTATVIIEEDRTLSLVNSKFEELSGFPREKIEGKMKWSDFVVKEDLEKMINYHQKRRVNPAEVPKNYEFRFKDRAQNIKEILLYVDMIPGTQKSIASLLDITHRKIIEQELENFVYLVSHDISNSLSVIEGFVELCTQHDSTCRKKIRSKIDYLSKLLERSIILANAGLIVKKEEIVELNELITSILFLLGDDIKQIDMHFDSLPKIRCDKEKIQQIFTNIFDNIYKHGNPQNIWIKKVKNPNSLVLKIMNDGEQIDIKTVENLMQDYDSLAKTDEGIGLKIIKRLIIAHGWVINIRIEEEKYTTYEIHIPLSDIIEY